VSAAPGPVHVRCTGIVTAEAGSTRAKRPKRSTAELRRRILDAAEELFAAKGYGGATTREIALKAETTEAAIFRAFTSKQELFNAAVLMPFENFMAHYSGEWLPDPARGTPQEALREFAEDLYTLVSEHRHIFTAVVTNSLVGPAAQPVFDRLEQVSDAIKDEYGLQWTPLFPRAPWSRWSRRWRCSRTRSIRRISGPIARGSSTSSPGS
jgi:AcrR family transcriptional regulator